MADVYLWSVPSDANRNDVRLRDPTSFTPPVGGDAFMRGLSRITVGEVAQTAAGLAGVLQE